MSLFLPHGRRRLAEDATQAQSREVGLSWRSARVESNLYASSAAGAQLKIKDPNQSLELQHNASASPPEI